MIKNISSWIWSLLLVKLSFVTPYNILNIDGGGIKGIIPATCLAFFEEYAYEYAMSKNYDIPKYKNETTNEMIKRMPMKDIFDMIAGTSTGSILATGLSISSGRKNPIPYKGRNDDLPKYWAEGAVDIYTGGGAAIFRRNGLTTGVVVVAYVLCILFFLTVFGLIGYCVYDNPKTKVAH